MLGRNFKNELIDFIDNLNIKYKNTWGDDYIAAVPNFNEVNGFFFEVYLIVRIVFWYVKDSRKLFELDFEPKETDKLSVKVKTYNDKWVIVKEKETIIDYTEENYKNSLTNLICSEIYCSNIKRFYYGNLKNKERLEELKKTINFYFEGITNFQASIRIVNKYNHPGEEIVEITAQNYLVSYYLNLTFLVSDLTSERDDITIKAIIITPEKKTENLDLIGTYDNTKIIRLIHNYFENFGVIYVYGEK